MFINITDSETGNNKGSCGKLVKYLEKENSTAVEEGREKERWFNNLSNAITPQEVRVKIDNNIAKLGKNDAKFFLINISPSSNEIRYLKEQFGAKGAEEELKKYAVGVMDAYARNFKRSGIESSNDLLWYGKLERHRYYHHTDEEVKQAVVKAGDRKTGEQMHVQIIVSRKDSTNKIKLSPMNTSRGRNQLHSAKLGQFNRVAFKEFGELLFDQMFKYNRQLKDSMSYALKMKNGNTEQKKAIYLLNQLEREDSRGINGKALIGDDSKKVWNDSQLNKEALTNSFNEYENNNIKPEIKESHEASSKIATKEGENLPQKAFDHLSDFIDINIDFDKNDGSLIDVLGGLLIPETQGEDYEEQDFANKMRKRKRKRRG